MSDEEQRIAIAELDGWTEIHLKWRNWDGPDIQDLIGIPNTEENKRGRIFEDIPYYSQNPIRFAALLHGPSFPYIKEKGVAGVSDFDKHNASAAQRCEAYLKTMNKFKKEWKRSFKRK